VEKGISGKKYKFLDENTSRNRERNLASREAAIVCWEMQS